MTSIEADKRCDDLRAYLRTRVLEEIKEQGFTHAELAKRLDLLETGVVVLLSQHAWDLENAMRMAFLLGLEVEINVRRVQ